jgi:RNA polymerase sigma factor (sigma-70 family)
MNGPELLAEYREHGSERAFSELVRRFAHLVYAVAKRQVQESQTAEDVSQTVFIRLAKAALGCSTEGELVAWLHRTTLHVAVDAWRSESRRRARELRASYMEPAPADGTKLWEEVAPHLDLALNRLKDPERQAILLRFFQQKPMREVGQALGISEDAAKMRVARALDRLRGELSASGVACSTAALMKVLLSRAVEAAPLDIMARLEALAGLTTPGAGAMSGVSLMAELLLMSTKTKIIIGLLVCGLIGIAVHRGLSPRSRDQFMGEASPQRSVNLPEPNRLSVRARGALAPTDNISLDVLEDLKAQLRAMLQRPSAARGNPPEPLRELLAKFGDQVLEAVPVLLEAVSQPDYETRLWAVGGLKSIIADNRENRPNLSRQAFQMARAALTAILLSEVEPDLLRGVTVEVYVPSIIYDAQGVPFPMADMHPGADEDVLGALKAHEKRSFRFSVVDQLTQYLRVHPEQAAAYRVELEPMLKDSKASQRFLAAYALAFWPGENPAGVKRELLRELKETSKYSHHAAQALGNLGEAGVDTVPELLAYAERTRQWTAGYSSSALEAVCRLRPELRTEYPEINRKLVAEEALPLQHPPNATPQVVPIQPQEPPADSRPTALVSLILDARVLLVEHNISNREKIEAALRPFEAPGSSVTPENYASLSKALRDIDPQFEDEWRKTVAINYPWLDRVLTNR